MIGTETSPAEGGGAPKSDAKSLQVLMIGLGREILAIETDLVREIIDPVPRTPVPGARGFIASLVNVRGNVIPLADLTHRLGMPRSPETADTRIVVLDLDIGGDPVTVGILADKVHEVTEVELSRSLPTPRIGAQWNPEFVRFMVRWNGDFVIVPDLDLILNQ